MKSYLKISFEDGTALRVGAGGYSSLNNSDLLAKLDRLLKPLSAKRFGAGEEIDRLKPIRFPLPIVSINDVELRPPNNLPTQVPEVCRFNFSEEHSGILTRGPRASDAHRHDDVFVLVVTILGRL